MAMEKTSVMADQETAIQPVSRKSSPTFLGTALTDLRNAIGANNPILKMVLGLCPVLAISNSVVNAFAMSVASTFVLTSSNTVVSLIRNYIPARVRIPSFIVVIAAFVTVVDLVLAAYFFELHGELGLFIPLIVTNCIILARAEAFGAKNTPGRAMVDGLSMGLGFMVPLVVLGAIREILGNGTLLGFTLFGEGYIPMVTMILPAGAFLVLGFMTAFFNRFIRGEALAHED
jgi:Na+-translocating ferredoxin:NAD+ oxidoreductase subunit E